MSVVIETTIGDITVDLFTEERPIACLNFLKLCQLKYYNFNLFHTVERGFIAQTGDPSGSGEGGSSIWGLVENSSKRFFEAESLPKIYHSSAGLLSLVSVGKNLVASQFFFTLGENLSSLDGIHCVIGEIVEGQETLRKLNEAIVDEHFRPYQDIRITHTVVLDDPFPNPRGFKLPDGSPSPSIERLQNGRIAADEDIDDTDGKTMEEIQEMLAEKEAKARATILEIVGDLPDADIAPPENVLFVCKLNPVTTDDDLEIIFSRFGKVKGCEVIRDRKTGESLQYAFVEFEEQKSCEAAYFKMDNVLIDDRRIHVDFSQSVAKVKWRGKGRGLEGDRKNLDFNNLREGHSKKYSDREFRSKDERSKDEPSRLTLEERRKAREERHREQDRKRRSSRSRSRHNEVQHRRYEERKRRSIENTRYERRRSNSRERELNGRTQQNRYRHRSPSKYDRHRQFDDRKHSPSRNHGRGRSHERTYFHKTEEDPKYLSIKSDRTRKPQQQAISRRNHKSDSYKKESKTRKRMSSSKSSDESASEASSTDTSSSNEFSSSTSSSEEERRRKKKTKKAKKKKNRHSKTKKHKK